MVSAPLRHRSVPGAYPIELEFPVDVPPEPADRPSRRALRLDGKDIEVPERAKLLLRRLEESISDESIAMGAHPHDRPDRVGQAKHDHRQGLDD